MARMDFVVTILRRARPCTPPQEFSENQTLSQGIIIPWGRDREEGGRLLNSHLIPGAETTPTRPRLAPPPPVAGSRALLSS